MAILFALRSPALEVLGITTVFGNADIEVATANALRLVELAGRSVPVAAGRGPPAGRAEGAASRLRARRGRPRQHRAPPPEDDGDRGERGRAHRRHGPPLPRAGDARRGRSPHESRPGPGARASIAGARQGSRAHGGLGVRRRQRHSGGRGQHLGRPPCRGHRVRRSLARDHGRPRRDHPRAPRGRSAPAHGRGRTTGSGASCIAAAASTSSSTTQRASREGSTSTIPRRWPTPSTRASSPPTRRPCESSPRGSRIGQTVAASGPRAEQWEATRGRPAVTVCRDVDGERLLRLFEATVTP